MVEITKALVKFHMEVGKIKKDAQNPFFNSSYASLSNILDVVTPVLVQCDLNIVQMPTGEGKLKTMLMHTSGEMIESEFDMHVTKRDPQAMGSAITYARRYAIGALLNLNIEDDDDANQASAPSVPKQRSQAPTTSQNTSDEDKPWLNALDKQGNLTDLGKQVAMAIVDGKRTWVQIREKNKVSKKDQQAVDDYIAELKTPKQVPTPFDEEDISSDLPF
jgi:hypothetical protein